MKIKRLVPLALLALAGSQAGAAVVSNYQSGDIFLGVRVSGGTGQASSYLVDLGADTKFTNATGTFTLTSLGNLGADLQSLYGANWSSRADLSIGIFGALGSGPAATLYASRQRLSLEIASEPWPLLNNSGRSGTLSEINSVRNAYNGKNSTSNSPFAITQSNDSSSASYNFQVATPGVLDFGGSSQWDSIEATGTGGIINTALDLYRISPSAVTSPGYFTINDAGALTFTVVPEPASLLLLAFAGALVGGIRLRRPTTAA
ncbi:MAG: hypothetical protein JWL90_1921 [Chthoniobacteraceae bacterium]|nr:hypothetical protein [Chthoniobacteraceae bacterium]